MRSVCLYASFFLFYIISRVYFFTSLACSSSVSVFLFFPRTLKLGFYFFFFFSALIARYMGELWGGNSFFSCRLCFSSVQSCSFTLMFFLLIKKDQKRGIKVPKYGLSIPVESSIQYKFQFNSISSILFWFLFYPTGRFPSYMNNSTQSQCPFAS